MRIVKINRALGVSVSAVVPLHLSGRPPGHWLRGQNVLLLCLGVFLVLLAPLIAFGPDLLALVQPATATVVIVPANDREQVTVPVYAISNGSPGQDQISARLLSAGMPAAHRIVRATGIVHQAAREAAGDLTFYNVATYAQTIAAGTILAGADGVQVATDEAVIVPGGNPLGSATVHAHARSVGSRGNISPFDVNGLCCAPGVAVKNLAAFTSGLDAETYTTVLQQDIAGAVAALSPGLVQNAQVALEEQVLPNEGLVGTPSCPARISTDHQVGERAAQVTVSVSVICTAYAYDREGAERFASALFVEQTGRALGAGYALASPTMASSILASVVDEKSGLVSVLVRVAGIWVYRWTPAHLQAMARHIAGKPAADALALLLREEGVAAVRIVLRGGNGSTLPTDVHRITMLESITGQQGLVSSVAQLKLQFLSRPRLTLLVIVR